MTVHELATLHMSAEVLLWALGVLVLMLGPWLLYAHRYRIIKRFKRGPVSLNGESCLGRLASAGSNPAWSTKS